MPLRWLDIRRVKFWFVGMAENIQLPTEEPAIRVFREHPHHSLSVAVIAGFGAEMPVRARFYVGTQTDANGKPTDVLKGLFDLIEWRQKFALSKASVALAVLKLNRPVTSNA